MGSTIDRAVDTWTHPPHFLVMNRERNTVLADAVEAAWCSEDRRRGLLGRTQFGSGRGLWISPCEAIHTFGMRFPIDAVFLDRQFRVRKIRTNLAPRRIALCWPAHSVLELPAGTVCASQTQVGDQLRFTC